MHDCPECGQACDCDEEDTWIEDDEIFEQCIHECEDFEDEEDDPME